MRSGATEFRQSHNAVWRGAARIATTVTVAALALFGVAGPAGADAGPVSGDSGPRLGRHPDRRRAPAGRDRAGRRPSSRPTPPRATAGPDVLSVQGDEPVHALESGSENDPMRSQQWALDKVSFESAWSMTRGRGVTVAVIDSGVEADHQDLAGLGAPGQGLREPGRRRPHRPQRSRHPRRRDHRRPRRQRRSGSTAPPPT